MKPFVVIANEKVAESRVEGPRASPSRRSLLCRRPGICKIESKGTLRERRGVSRNILGLLIMVLGDACLDRVYAKCFGDVAKGIVVAVEVVIDSRTANTRDNAAGEADGRDN